jgi:hypothetical protein
MAKPTDSVLLILQQIQATLAEHTRLHQDHSRRFDKIDRRMDEMHDSRISAVGLAGHANLRHDSVNDRPQDLTRRVEELERTK